MLKKTVAVIGFLGATVISGTSMAGPVVDAIRSRGELACGVRGDTLGFAHREANGRYSGLDVDMCRTVAAAVLGDAGKVKFVPLEPEKRFDALKEGRVDILAAGTTLTLSRDVAVGVDFPTIYFYDTQAFMALRKPNRKSLKDMKGASVCVQAGTTTERHAREWSFVNKMDFKLVEFTNLADMRKAFFGGKCDLYTADRSAVYVTRQAYAEIPQEYLIFPEAISNEPLALAIQDTDRRFSEIVRWAFNVLVAADEYGILSRNVDEIAKSDNPILKRLLGVSPGLGQMLGLDDKWAYTIIKQVGSYGEIYERTVGTNSQLKIPRALNTQASVGGMLYALPFR